MFQGVFDARDFGAFDEVQHPARALNCGSFDEQRREVFRVATTLDDEHLADFCFEHAGLEGGQRHRRGITAELQLAMNSRDGHHFASILAITKVDDVLDLRRSFVDGGAELPHRYMLEH